MFSGYGEVPNYDIDFIFLWLPRMVWGWVHLYEVWQYSLWTRHRVLAMAAVDRTFSMVWWRWHISVSQLCYCWSMAVSFWVAFIIVSVCFGVPSRECRSLELEQRTLNFLLNFARVQAKPSLFTGSSRQWLFSVPEDERNIERKEFWWHWWHQE
jgi:hypothetical protein